MSSTEVFLKNFHLENPGCTPAAFFAGKSSGQNSYSFLSSILKDTDSDKTLIDLACGDGTLMKQVLAREIRDLRVIGIDMSPGELTLAKKTLGNYRFELIEARAQTLPVLNDSADFIFCHMAFMLMDELDLVVSEIHRCLKPQGIFSAIVGGKSEISSLFKSFLGLLKQALADENKQWLSNLGDARTRSADGLKSLFKEDRFSNIDINEIKLEFSSKPTELVDFFMLMYDVGLLSISRRSQLHSDLLQLLESNVDSDGFVHHYIWLRQITCQRR